MEATLWLNFLLVEGVEATMGTDIYLLTRQRQCPTNPERTAPERNCILLYTSISRGESFTISVSTSSGKKTFQWWNEAVRGCLLCGSWSHGRV
ncbi:hypothetical protein BJY00DRAFT_289481 [Aspergillus carlsbadensis]|nr:hypothetical protein BJY00DRAFT_289481 [Aspergillus carlsbadensis]